MSDPTIEAMLLGAREHVMERDYKQEEPLHVQVARALGWHKGADYDSTGHCRKCGVHLALHEAFNDLLRYDTDWSATGPLIQQHRLALLLDEANPPTWRACSPTTGHSTSAHPTPLIAVCNLILALSAAGKLEAA